MKSTSLTLYPVFESVKTTANLLQYISLSTNWSSRICLDCRSGQSTRSILLFTNILWAWMQSLFLFCSLLWTSSRHFFIFWNWPIWLRSL